MAPHTFPLGAACAGWAAQAGRKMASGTKVVSLIPIRDMNRAIRFYTKSLGGKLKFRGTGEMRNFWAWIQLGAGDIWLIAPGKREKRTLAYTTLVVTNIRATVRSMLKKGVKFQRPDRATPETKIVGPIAFEPVGAAAFFKDPEGNLLMVWQSAR